MNLKKRYSIPLGVLAATLVLILVALSVGPYFINTDEFRKHLDAWLEDATGREVTISGPVSVTLFPFAGFDIQDVRVFASPEFGKSVVARADAIGIRLRLLPLLRKHIDVRSFQIRGLDVRLVWNDDGVLNLGETKALPTEGGTEAGWTFGFKDSSLSLRDSRLSLDNRREGVSVDISNVSAKYGFGADQKGLRFTGDTSARLRNGWPFTSWDGQILIEEQNDYTRISGPLKVSNLRVNLRADAVTRRQAEVNADFTAFASWDFRERTFSIANGQLNMEGLFVGIGGNFRMSGAGLAAYAVVTARTEDPRRTFAALNLDAPAGFSRPDEALELSVSCAYETDSLRLDDIRMSIFGSTISGNAGLTFGERLRASIALDADSLDFEALLPKMEDGSAQAFLPEEGGKRPLASLLKALDFDLHLKAGKAVCGAVEAHDAIVELSAEGGKVVSRALGATFPLGRATGRLTATSNDEFSGRLELAFHEDDGSGWAGKSAERKGPSIASLVLDLAGEMKDYRGTLTVPSFSPRRVLRDMGVSLAGVSPQRLRSLSAKAEFLGGPDFVQVARADIVVDGLKIFLSGILRDFANPAVDFAASMDSCDLREHFAISGRRKDKPGQAGTVADSWKKDILPPPLGVRANGKVAVKRLVFPGVSARNVRMSVSADGSGYALRLQNAEVVGGKITGTLSAKRSKVPKFDAALDFSGLRAEEAAGLFAGSEVFKGAISGAVRISGGGRSLDGLASQLTGTLNAKCADAAVRLPGTEAPTALKDVLVKANLAPSPRSGGAHPEFRGSRPYALNVSMRGGGKSGGELADVSFSGDVWFTERLDAVCAVQGKLSAHAALPGLPGRHKDIRFEAKTGWNSNKRVLAVRDASGSLLGMNVSGSARLAQGNAGPSLQGRLRVEEFSPRNLWQKSGRTWQTIDPEVLKKASLSTNFGFEKGVLALSNLTVQLDDTTVKGEADFDPSRRHHIHFDISGDFFDVDRYRFRDEAPDSEVRMPLGFLQKLSAEGKASLGRLKIYRMNFYNSTAQVKARKGQMSAFPVRAVCSGGEVTGRAYANASATAFGFGAEARLTEAEFGEFMEDVAGRDYVRGNTDLTLSIAASGDTDNALLASMSGSARLTILNGSYKFSDAPKHMPSKRNTDSGDLLARIPKSERTGFERAEATVILENGVASNKDMEVTQPYAFTGKGAGYADLNKGYLDYLVTMRFLKAATIPIRLRGDFDDVQVSVETLRALGSSTTDIAKDILNLPFGIIKSIIPGMLLPGSGESPTEGN